MLSHLSIVIVAAVAIAGQSDSPPSHQKHLEDIGWWVGTWDVEGTMSDGQEFTGQHTWRWSMNKNFLTGNITSSTGGKSVVEARFVVGWEPTKKEIKGWEFWKDGYRGTFVVTDDGTRLEGSGEDNDGRQTWTGKSKLSDDRNSYSYKATIKKADGTEAAFQFDAVKNKSPRRQRTGDAVRVTEIPPKAWKALKFFVGKWEGETFENGESLGGGVDERTWLPGKHCILMKGVDTEEEAERHSAGISGWDAKGEQLVENWHATDGLHAVIRYPLSGMKKDIWEGNFTVTFGDGGSYDGTCRLEIEDNGWTWTARWKQDGKEMVRKSISRRMKKQ